MNTVEADVGSSLLTLSGFLQYGPIGFAAFMLALVIFALNSGPIDEIKERLLKRFLHVGAFCFVVAAVLAFLPGSPHWLYLRVEPLEEVSAQKLPPPTVTVNGSVLKNPVAYHIGADVTAIVDVNEAINFIKEYATITAKQETAITSVATILTKVQSALAAQGNLAVNDSCSGGPNGIPSNHSAEITALNRSLSADIANISGIITSAAKITPPSPPAR